jgi:hypothetical protein
MTGRRKCFALSPDAMSYTDLTPPVYGCYSFKGGEFPAPYQVAKKIMIDLAQGNVTEEQLEERAKLVESA